MSNLDSSDHRTLFHFETVHFKWALAHRTRRGFWTIFTRSSFLHERALVGICRWHGGLCLPTVVSGSIPGPFSNVNDRILPMSDAVSSEGPKTTGIQQRSSALFSSWWWWCFDDVMHCRYCIPQSFYVLFHRLKSLCPSLLLRDSASLKTSLLLLIMLQNLMTINLISC